MPDDHAEISGYVDAFRVSSDRSRRIIFVIITICVLIFIATWNLNKLSWARIRMAKAAQLRAEANTVAKKAAMAGKDVIAAQNAALPTDQMYGRLVVEKYPEEYVKQMLVVHIPALGISTDVNEIGLLGGITLTLLMTLLLVALMRQHENLYLSLFKIRRLHERDQRKTDGETLANYLYHSLAMSQLLIMPPTLARWPARDRQPVVTAAVKMFFIVPAALQLYIALTNWVSPIPVFYNAAPRGKLIVQMIFAGVLFALGVACSLYVRAMDKRWRAAFFYINPDHESKQPMHWTVWLKLRSRWSKKEKDLREKLAEALLNEEGSAGEAGSPLREMVITTNVRADHLTKKRVPFISHRLMKRARDEALDWCNANHHTYVQLEGFTLTDLRRTGKRAAATIDWWFSFTDQRQD